VTRLARRLPTAAPSQFFRQRRRSHTCAVPPPQTRDGPPGLGVHWVRG
jgi:hypothetical protein